MSRGSNVTCKQCGEEVDESLHRNAWWVIQGVMGEVPGQQYQFCNREHAAEWFAHGAKEEENEESDADEDESEEAGEEDSESTMMAAETENKGQEADEAKDECSSGPTASSTFCDGCKKNWDAGIELEETQCEVCKKWVCGQYDGPCSFGYACVKCRKECRPASCDASMAAMCEDEAGHFCWECAAYNKEHCPCNGCCMEMRWFCRKCYESTWTILSVWK